LGRFFTELEKGDSARAADAISLEFQLDDSARKRFRSRLKDLVAVAGVAESWHVVEIGDVAPGDRLYSVLAVSHHAKRPVGWSLSLYRLGDGRWSVLSVGFDSDDVAAFLRQARAR